MKKTLLFSVCMLALTGALAGCQIYPPTPHPDYAIRVKPTASGGVAAAQPCADWETQNVDPFDNQPMPQFGCSTQSVLADEIERPNDLLDGRALSPARGVTTVGAVRRYDNNQTRGLIVPASEVSQPAVSTAPSVSSAMSGDVTGGGSSSPSSSSSTATSAGP